MPTLYCSTCGNVGRPGQPFCPYCGWSSPLQHGSIRPTQAATREIGVLPPPLSFALPDSSVVLLSSAPGAGKSSLAGMTRPVVWFTTEQTPAQVAVMFHRLGQPVPLIEPLLDEDREQAFLAKLRDLALAPGSMIVVDSLTPFGINGGVLVLNELIRKCRRFALRAFAIAQTTQADKIAGSRRLQFDVDVLGIVEYDPFNRRVFRLPKNRNGGLLSSYFQFTAEGGVEVPRFAQDVAHSIEGDGTAFTLVPFGVKRPRPQYADLLQRLADKGRLTNYMGHASAAMLSAGSTTGFIEPPDVAFRRLFSERHGMPWLDLDETLDEWPDLNPYQYAGHAGHAGHAGEGLAATVRAHTNDPPTGEGDLSF